MSRDLAPLPEALLPLHLAVREVHAAVYENLPTTVERLSGIAQVAVATVSVYTLGEGGSDPQRIDAETLGSALVRQAGKELHFIDRPPIRVLLVTRSGVDEVIGLLRKVPS